MVELTLVIIFALVFIMGAPRPRPKGPEDELALPIPVPSDGDNNTVALRAEELLFPDVAVDPDWVDAQARSVDVALVDDAIEEVQFRPTFVSLSRAGWSLDRLRKAVAIRMVVGRYPATVLEVVGRAQADADFAAISSQNKQYDFFP